MLLTHSEQPCHKYLMRQLVVTVHSRLCCTYTKMLLKTLLLRWIHTTNLTSHITYYVRAIIAKSQRTKQFLVYWVVCSNFFFMATYLRCWKQNVNERIRLQLQIWIWIRMSKCEMEWSMCKTMILHIARRLSRPVANVKSSSIAAIKCPSSYLCYLHVCIQNTINSPIAWTMEPKVYDFRLNLEMIFHFHAMLTVLLNE